MAIYRNLISGAVIEETSGGRRITETVIVPCEEMIGATPGAKLISALDHVSMPDRLDAHPDDANLKLLSLRGAGEASGVMRFTLEWGAVSTLDTTGVAIGRFSVVEEETSQDKNGTYMLVTYTGALQNFFPEGWGFVGGITVDGGKGLTATVARPRFGFDLVKRYTGASALATVLGLGTTYRGKINSTLWTGTINLAARSVLCTGVSWDQKQTEEIVATFSFEHDPDGWDFHGVITAYNREPANLSTATTNGRATYEMYDEADFNSLGVHL